MLTHRHFLETCKVFARASHARRSKVGAVIVKNGNIIAIGYNGTPAGFNNDCEDRDGKTRPEVLHAESNCITKIAKSTQSSEDAIMYTTMSPCFECAKLIIQAGIFQVYYEEEYRNTDGIELLKKAGIHVEKI